MIISKLCILSSIIIFIFIYLYYKKYESFNISLEKQHRLYMDYRNYIDGNTHLLPRYNNSIRKIPYKISTNCFNDKYSQCIKKIKNIKNKTHFSFQEKVKICEDQTYDKCIIP
jgi:hypothetical protein